MLGQDRLEQDFEIVKLVRKLKDLFILSETDRQREDIQATLNYHETNVIDIDDRELEMDSIPVNDTS